MYEEVNFGISSLTGLEEEHSAVLIEDLFQLACKLIIDAVNICLLKEHSAVQQSDIWYKSNGSC